MEICSVYMVVLIHKLVFQQMNYLSKWLTGTLTQCSVFEKIAATEKFFRYCFRLRVTQLASDLASLMAISGLMNESNPPLLSPCLDLTHTNVHQVCGKDPTYSDAKEKHPSTSTHQQYTGTKDVCRGFRIHSSKKKHSPTRHSKEHLRKCTVLSQLKVVYGNTKV